MLWDYWCGFRPVHGFYSNNTLFFQAVFSYMVLCLRLAVHHCGTLMILSLASEQEQSPQRTNYDKADHKGFFPCIWAHSEESFRKLFFWVAITWFILIISCRSQPEKWRIRTGFVWGLCSLNLRPSNPGLNLNSFQFSVPSSLASRSLSALLDCNVY